MPDAQRLYIRPQIFVGSDALAFLGRSVRGRVGIITDGFMVRSGMIERVLRHLSGCQVQVFSEVTPDPDIDMVFRGTGAMAAFAPDTVIALGGGSPIDAAKAVVAALRGMERPPDGAGAITFIAIPTTSGTGSEVSEYAVIADPERGVKHPLRSEDLLPDVALLDPGLTRSLPSAVTADTGMDVITHGLEAYVSTGANDFSDGFAEKALSLACVWLPEAYADGENLEAREKMHVASCMAGMAFNSAGLGLNHGIAHALGAVLHMPHGRINAMLLPHVIDFNAEQYRTRASAGPSGSSVAERYGILARRLGRDVSTLREGVRGLVREIRWLNKFMKIPATLVEAGADMQLLAQHRKSVVEAALADPTTATNPRKVTVADVEMILDLVAGCVGKRW